jgi:serine/threonine protein kinase
MVRILRPCFAECCPDALLTPGDPLRPYTSLVVTLWYRAPELLLGTKLYGTAIDMWSAGCIFAEVLNGSAPLQGKAESEQLELTIKLCGTPSLKDWPDLANLKSAKRFDFERSTIHFYFCCLVTVDLLAWQIARSTVSVRNSLIRV